MTGAPARTAPRPRSPGRRRVEDERREHVVAARGVARCTRRTRAPPRRAAAPRSRARRRSRAAAGVLSGPIVASGSRPGPTTVCSRSARGPSTTSSKRCARHVQPLERHADLAGGHERRAAICAISASSKAASSSTIAGSLPPSSSVTLREVGCGHLHDPPAAADAAGEADVLDARVADDDRADHRVGAGDDVEHAGRQREGDVAQRPHDDIGVVGGGFTTTVLPAISAYGRDAARMASGQLNGKMIVTTPTGRWAIVVVNGGPSIVSSSSTLGATAPPDGSGRPGRAGRSSPRTGSCRSRGQELGALVGVGLEPSSAARASCTRSGVGQRRPGGPGLVRGADGVEGVSGGCGGGVPDHLAVRRVVDREGIGGRPLLAPDQQRRGRGAHSQRRTSLSYSDAAQSPNISPCDRADRHTGSPIQMRRSISGVLI